MKGYKVFNSDWTCKGFYYEVGKTYHMDGEIKCGERGFHFSERLADCFSYREFTPRNRFAEVEALGRVMLGYDQCCTDTIKIVREIVWAEVLRLVDCGGEKNTGWGNSGSYNSGNRNTGNYNSGNRNAGSCNSGDRNIGGYNSGVANLGDGNAGRFNSNNYNSGNGNSGRCNSGDYNPGNFNAGNRNVGDCNTGKYNYGNYNSGKYNTGHYNAGDFNFGNCNTGVFNTKSPKINMFDVPSDWTLKDWLDSEAHYSMQYIPVDHDVWVELEDMTEYEKQRYPDCKIAGGYLKFVNDSQHRQKWWDALTDKDKDVVMSLPNFDADKFKKCTGIKVKKD